MTLLAFLIGWLLLSIPASLFIGRLIATGMGTNEQPFSGRDRHGAR